LDLEVARDAFKFIRDEWRDLSTGEWAVQTGAAGARKDILRGSESLSVATSGYGGAFIAEGMVEYHRATGDPLALELSLKGTADFVKLVDNPSHQSDTHLPQLVDGSHCLGHSMIILSLTRQLLEAPSILIAGSSEEQEIVALNQRAVEEVDSKFWMEKYQLLGEVLDANFEKKEDLNQDFFYLGHGIETLWMLMAEALRRQDNVLYMRAAERFRRHVEMAWDEECGGVYRGVHMEEKKFLIDDDCKVKWAQDEVVVGCALVIERHPESHADRQWACEMLYKMRTYIREKFVTPLRERGCPYVMVGGDREVTFRERYVNQGQPGVSERIASRKEHYHHPRSIMLLLEAAARCANGGA